MVSVVSEQLYFHHIVHTDSGATQPLIQWVPGVLSLGVKQARHEVDHFSPNNAEIMDIYTHSTIRPHGFVFN